MNMKIYILIFLLLFAQKQNGRGLKTDSRLTKLVHAAQWRKAFSICLSETWREQSEEFISDPSAYTFLGPWCWPRANFK